MWLKIVAVFYAVCFSVSAFNPAFYETPFRAIGSGLAVVGLIGVFVVAFKRPFLSERFWRSFSLIYVGYVLSGLLLGARTLVVEHGFWGLVGAVASGAVFQFPILLSLWKLSFATPQSGPQRFDETAAPSGHP
ncbi:hypothetical protein RAD15_41815 [Bradyrhizobium sp. 14AA]